MKVTIFLLTYNHEKFIAQAIESILMQEVNFAYEIVIAEDCSTDKTRDIVIDFQQKQPDKIRLFLAERNLNSNSFYVQGLQICQGQYIALLDGDDYWSSPDKLQKQVDFLDANPELSICFHNVNVVYEEGNIATHLFHLKEPNYHISKSLPKSISTLEDIVVNGNFMQTCSVMFRAGLFGNIPDWYNNLPIGDWPLHILNAEHGNIGYIDAVLGTYRVHRGGLWSTNMSQERKFENAEKMIYLCETIEQYLKEKYIYKFNTKALTYYYKQALTSLFKMQKYREANSYAKNYLSRLSWQDLASMKFVLQVILAAQFPPAYSILKFLRNVYKNKIINMNN